MSDFGFQLKRYHIVTTNPNISSYGYPVKIYYNPAQYSPSMYTVPLYASPSPPPSVPITAQIYRSNYPMGVPIPIVKFGPAILSYSSVPITIMSAAFRFTIMVPLNMVRGVINDLFFNGSVDLSKLDPKDKVEFRFITPMHNFPFASSYAGMKNAVTAICAKYEDKVQYKYNNESCKNAIELLKKVA